MGSNATNVAKFRQLRQTYEFDKMLADLSIGRFGDFGKIGKFSPNCQTYANERNWAKLSEAKHVGRFGDFGKIGKFDEFDKILPNSPNCQTYANEQNSGKPNLLADLANLATFRQIR